MYQNKWRTSEPCFSWGWAHSGRKCFPLRRNWKTCLRSRRSCSAQAAYQYDRVARGLRALWWNPFKRLHQMLRRLRVVMRGFILAFSSATTSQLRLQFLLAHAYTNWELTSATSNIVNDLVLLQIVTNVSWAHEHGAAGRDWDGAAVIEADLRLRCRKWLHILTLL